MVKHIQKIYSSIYTAIIAVFILLMPLASVGQTILLSEDFDMGFPADWTNTVIEGPTGYPGWEWTLIGGAYGGELNSTTSANGYMILDSDAHGVSVANPEDAELISPPIDCSEFDIINLSLEHWARSWADMDISIIISTDDFSTETVVYNWTSTTDDYNGSNPVESKFDISAYAAGANGLKIKFKFQGDWEYWWLIDDVEVTGLEAPLGNTTDLVYWLRSDMGVTGTNPVTDWEDQSGNGNDGISAIGPELITSADMNNQEALLFDGNDELTIGNNARINTSEAFERTMFIAFNTEANVTSRQYIYEEGGATNGLGVFIYNGSVYVTIYNDGGTERITSYQSINPNEAYVLSFNWNNGNLSALLNNVSFTNQTTSASPPGSLSSHGADITIGRAGGTTIDETGGSVGGGLEFSGEIAELIYYDKSLAETDEVEVNTILGEKYGIDVSTDYTIYYSYQAGDWNQASTWTHDPGGTTQTATDFPNSGDKVVILSGRSVTLSSDVDTTNLDIAIREGGILDQATYQFSAGLSALSGSGTFKLASENYPTVTTNDFVNTDGGTTEYDNTVNFDLPASQATYYHLRINAPGITATQLSNITLNGDLHVKQGTFQINDNSANRQQLSIGGDVLVEAGASLTVGTGNTVTNDLSGETSPAPYIDYYDRNSHRVVVFGDFTNKGTVRFTNQSYPVYNAFPNNGMATVYFRGATNNILKCEGTTDFYNLVLDKGIDQTYKLSIYSTAYQNFRLFGRNNQPGENGGPNPSIRKALWIRTGTLELKGLTIIPSLTEGGGGGTPNGDYFLPANGSLLLNGTEVIVLTTANDYAEVNAAYGLSEATGDNHGVSVGGTQAFSVYGKLQVNEGYLSSRRSAGFITWAEVSGEVIINGGTVDTRQMRSSGAVGLAAFYQTGGTLNLRGRLSLTQNPSTPSDIKNATFSGAIEAGDLSTGQATLNINNPENVFSMSGGTINIFDVTGGNNYAIDIFSEAKNINVTGGAVNIKPQGTASNPFIIRSAAPFYNFEIENEGTGNPSVDLYDASGVSGNLNVINDLTITDGDLNARNYNVTVGGDFVIEADNVYTPGTNWTIFNGASEQNFEINTTSSLDLFKWKIDKSSGVALNLSGTQNTLNVADSMMINSGTLSDGGKTINMNGSVLYNSGVHEGVGGIVLNDNNPQTIMGDGNGIFENIELNNTDGSDAPVTVAANTTINGTLTFSQDKLLNLSTYSLHFGADASVANAGTSRFIQTAGNAGDGGVIKAYSSTSTDFTFPVGAPSTNHTSAEYTPATIAFNSNPNTFGAITVVPVGYEHPNTTQKGRSLTYYWRVKSEGFALGSATVNHSYTYSQSDVASGGNVTEAGYVAAMYDNASYSWTKYSAAEVDDATNTIGDAGTTLETLDFIDGEFTAGDDTPQDPFGTPTIYYSRQSGPWNSGNTWSLIDHAGTPAGSVPGASDIVIVGGQDSVYLATQNTTPNTGVQNAATLKIEAGSALDIGYNPACNFGIVLSHENGNGNFRLTTSYNSGSTYAFPSGDFSDFNINLGTTELYTTNPFAGTTYWLPNDIDSYGNLIITPIGGSNIIFGNTDVLIYGDLITRGQDSRSWFCPNWRTQNYPTAPNVPVAKTITVNGNFDLQGGALIWYNRNNTGAQDFVIGGDLILDTDAGLQVFTNGNNNSQSITVSGSLINNSLAPGGGVNGYRGADFTDIPLIFTSGGVEYITNEDPLDNTYTIIESLLLDKGSSQSDSLVIDITGTFNTPNDGWLRLKNGTFKYLHDDNLSITRNSSFAIPSTAGLYLNSPANNIYLANDNVNDNDVFLSGKLTVIDGNVFIGQTSAPNNNNDIEYSGGGDSEIDIRGGSLTVNGQIRRNPSTSAGILKYHQSGGAVTINGRNGIAENAKLEILNTGSEFNMSGGTLTIVRGGGDGTFGDLYLRPEMSVVTGGEIIFNPLGAGDQNYIFDANSPVWDLTINGSGGDNASVTLLISPLEVDGDLSLVNNNSILDANANFDIPITINGDFNNSGVYTHRNNLTTFSGGTQAITGSSAVDFYDLTVHSLTKLTLNQDANINHDLILSRGTLACGVNTVYVQGDVTNNATYTDNNTGLVLNGKDQQSIFGTGTYGQLELNNKNGARLENDVTLQKDLVLTKGILDINDELFSLGTESDILGAPFDSTKMITSDGVYSNVGLRKFFSIYSGADKTFVFPIGTSGKYTPAILTYSDISNVGYIRVNNINQNHPGVFDDTNVLDYYWELESDGITGFNGSFLFNYLEEDIEVTGANTESDYIAAALLLPGTSWSKYGTDKVDESNNTISFNFSGSNSLSGEYTAGIDDALPDNVPEFTSINDGDWSDPNNWQQTGGDPYTLTGAPNGFIIIVDSDDVVTTDVDYASAYRINIRGELQIDKNTFGHNLGRISGDGRLYQESGTLPAGRYGDFLNCSNTAVLEYGGSTDYTLITDLYSTVPYLHFTGTGRRIIPNKDLTVCHQLLVDGPTLDNSINNRKLYLQGTFERYNSGAFLSGSGANATVVFEGTSEQTVGGALGDFAGPNAFNNLEVDNGAGLTINANGAIEVDGNLLLTNGNIVTSTTNTLTITNTDVNCVFPSGGSAASYVDGPLTKYINQGDDFQFPLGKGDVVGNKMTLSSVRNGTIAWTAEFFTPNSTYTDFASPLTYVNSKEYWKVDANVGDEAKIGITWDPISDLTPLMTQNGTSDMRVANFNTGTSEWEELSSVASGNNSNGLVTTSTEFVMPGGGTADFTTSCINITKPRARFNPSGAVCGDAGLPVSFTGVDATDLNYVLTYKKGGVAQPPVTITSLPFVLPTDVAGTTYQLTSFTYGNPATPTTGVVDPAIVTTYTVPTTANAGGDQSLCGGTSAVMAGNTPTEGIGQWSVVSGTGGSFVDPTDPTTTFNGTNGTTYTLRWTITNGGCFSTDEVVIAFPLLPVQPDPFTDFDLDVCQGVNAVTYAVPNDPSVTYTWSYTGTGVTINGTGNTVTLDFDNTATSGTLAVFATNGCGDSAPREIDITVNEMPQLTITVDANSGVICDGENTSMEIDFTAGSGTYDFTISDGANSENLTGISADPYTYNKTLVWVDDGTPVTDYHFTITTITDSNGCSNTNIGNELVKVYKIPETGETYHISNEHAK